MTRFRSAWVGSLVLVAVGLAVALTGSGTVRTVGGLVFVGAIVAHCALSAVAVARARPKSFRDLVSYRWIFGPDSGTGTRTRRPRSPRE